MYLNARERKIIELLREVDHAITTEEIAKKLRVSERTVYRDLKDLDSTLAKFNLHIRRKIGQGIQLIGDHADLKHFDQLYQDQMLHYTPEERRAIIFASLLKASDPMKLYTFSHELHVTMATISFDLNIIEEELSSYNLKLIRKRGYGIEIVGEEVDKRAAISYLIQQNVNLFKYVSLIRDDIFPVQSQNIISDKLLDFIDSQKINLIKKCVHEARKCLPYRLADSAYVGLIVHLALAIERLQQGENVSFNQINNYRDLEETKEFSISKDILKQMEKTLEIAIPYEEVYYITMHLLGAKLRSKELYVLEEDNYNLQLKTKKLISYVGKHIEEDLLKCSSLLNDLMTHLRPAIHRIKQNMQIRNPLLPKIKKEYQNLFMILKEGVKKLFPKLDFPEDEIGYLVLHFASVLLYGKLKNNFTALVICSSGIGTAKMLATNLMQKVPEIKSIDHKSIFEISNLHLQSYDIIVSTIPLNRSDIDYVLTSPLLMQVEVDRIKKRLRHRKVTIDKVEKEINDNRVEPEELDFVMELHSKAMYSEVVLNVLQSFHLKKSRGKKTLTEILKSVCYRIELEGIITDKDMIYTELMERSQLSGLGIPDTSLALFHTRSNKVNKEAFFIQQLSYPVLLKGMDGKEIEVTRILFMLAPKATNQEVLEILSYLSSLIILYGKESIRVFESGTKDEIRLYLIQQFQTLLLEKNNI
nr:BglG family transcription antiterminator [Roseburia sp. 1XD42-34]